MTIQPGHITDTNNVINCKTCQNKGCLIKKGVPEKRIQITSAMKKLYTVKKGDKLFSSGQLVEGVFFIQDGKMKIIYNRDNSKQLIRLAGNGDIVGHRGISQQMIYPIDAVALVKSDVCFFPLESFFKIRSENNDFDFQTMMFFADELKRSEEDAYSLSRKNDLEKIAFGLLKFLKAYGVDENNQLNYSPASQELSDMLNLDSYTIQKEISVLIEKGIIDSKKGDFIINKSMMLEGISEDSEIIKRV